MKKLKNNWVYLILALILIVHAVLLIKLIFFPYPELFIYPYLANSGLKPYSQILDQHFPGLLFLPINFDNLGLMNAEVARYWEIGVVFITQILLFITGRKLLGSPARALFVNFLYLVWQPFLEGWVLWIDSFLPLLLLPAFYFLLGDRRDKGNKDNMGVFWAGVFLGLGIVFKQVLIPLAGFTTIYIFLRERNLKAVLMHLLGIFIPLALMTVYIISIGVLKDFWYWNLVFNLTTYAEFGRGLGPTRAYLTRVLFIFGSAFLLLIPSKFKTRESQLLIIFMIGALIGLSTRFDFVHFQPALPFAVLATVYGFGKWGRLGIIGIYGLILVWWTIIFYKGHLGDRIISFDPDTLQLAAKIKSYTSPKEKLFVFGAAPHIYQMTNTLPAGDVFVFQFPWFLKVAEGRILEGIKKDKPEIIVSNRNVYIEGSKISDFAKNIDEYIAQNYQKIDNVNETEILRLKTP